MNIYWIGLTIAFSEPMPIVSDAKKSEENAGGFFQEIGCTGDNEEDARRMVVSELKTIDWLNLSSSTLTIDRIGLISASELQLEIYNDPEIREALIADPTKRGIWYISGRAFFSETIDDDTFYKVEICGDSDSTM